MDREFHKNECKNFQGEDDAYIHFEMKDGSASIMINGSTVSTLYAATILIDKVVERSGKSFEQVLMDIQDWYYSSTDEPMVIEKGARHK